MRQCVIKEKYGLRLGQRVIFIEEMDPDGGVRKGQLGTVCCLDKLYHANCVAVEWDKPSDRYHDCVNTCDNKHGWWVPHNMIAPYQNDIGEIQRSDIAIESLMGIF